MHHLKETQPKLKFVENLKFFENYQGILHNNKNSNIKNGKK